MAKTRKGEPAGGLGTSPSHLMHRALQQALDIFAEEAGPDGATQRQFAVLSVAADQSGLSQTDLVRRTGIDRSTLADLVARMAAKGLLLRQRSGADARAMTVAPSEAGLALLETMKPRVAAADRRLLALLPKARRERFTALLQELADAPAKAERDRADKARRKAAKAADKARKKSRKSEKAAAKPSVDEAA